MIPNISVF